MKLLVDEDSQARRLLDALRHAGHDVLSVAELGCNGLPDAQVFAQAQAQGRTLLTHNVADFLALAQQAGALQAAGLPVQGQFHILNHWR